MEGLGFIHEKLDIKILILYILNHLPAAVDGYKRIKCGKIFSYAAGECIRENSILNR